MWNWYCPYFSGAMLQFRVLTFVILYLPSPPKFQKYTIYIFLKSRHSQYGSNVWIYAPIIQTRLIHVNSKLCAMLLQPQPEFGFLGMMLCLLGGDLLFAANTQTRDWETQKAYISQWCFKMLYLTQKSVPMNFSYSFVQTIVQTPTLDTVWLDPILSGSSAKKFYIPEKSEEFGKKVEQRKFYSFIFNLIQTFFYKKL